VDIAASKPFQLVFMDIQMPGMDGLEATALLRKANFTAPIIAFSANAYSSDIQKSLEAGMQDHLCKPFEQSDLINALKKWL
jgi:CheY-like chemotaxis protein